MMSENGKIDILYLDDEDHNLSAFKATFRRSWNVRTANSAGMAIEMIQDREPEIIIADQRMPKVTGVEFFQEVYKNNPDPLRILLTGYTSSQTVIDAVNKGHIDRYLIKPWDKDMMEQVIRNGHEDYLMKVEIKRKNEELFRINEELNRFVYGVSHDLRAPLLSVLGLIDLCRDEKNENQLAEYFSLMGTSVRKMDDFIQTTLQYYRNLKTEIILEDVRFSELVNELILPLQNYNQYVSFELLVPEDAVIFSDRIRLKIALSNLISNAVKYGFQDPHKPYKVKIEVAPTTTGFKLIVSDRGKGIASDKLKRVFDLFFSEKSVSTIESSGLGLHLVKHSVEKLGGEVQVRSKVGVGTEFELNVPNRKNAN